MPQPPQMPVPMLGRSQQVAVQQVTVLPVAAAAFTKGGCDMPGRVIRLEVVDVPHGTQYIVPLEIGYAERLYTQLGDLITEHNKQALER